MAKSYYKKAQEPEGEISLLAEISLRTLRDNQLILTSWSVSYSQFACLLPDNKIILRNQNDLPYTTPDVIPVLAIIMYFCIGPTARKGNYIATRRRMGIITPERKVSVRISKNRWVEFDEFNTLIDDKTLNREYKLLLKRIFGENFQDG